MWTYEFCGRFFCSVPVTPTSYARLAWMKPVAWHTAGEIDGGTYQYVTMESMAPAQAFSSGTKYSSTLCEDCFYQFLLIHLREVVII